MRRTGQDVGRPKKGSAKHYRIKKAREEKERKKNGS